VSAAKEQKSSASLFKSLQDKNFFPVYLFYGEEEYLIEEYTDAVLSAVLQPGDADFNLDILYANDCDGAAIVNAAASFPMMADARVVVVKDFHALNEKSLSLLLKYVEKPSATTRLLLCSSELRAASAVIKKLTPYGFSLEAKPLYDNQIPPWIKNQLQKRGYTISDEAVAMLQANVGNSLRRLLSEIDKIELHLQGRKDIHIEDVETVVGLSKEFTVFELSDAVAEKKIKKSLRILNRLIDLGEPPIAILAMLTRHFVIIAKAKEMAAAKTQRDEIAKTLKIHTFFIDKYIHQTQLFTREHLTHIFSLLLNADQALKSSYQKPRLVLELLILEIYSLV